MSTTHERAWLDKRVPCWACSRSLQQMQNGPHKGKYVAVKATVDGFERFFHVFCFDTLKRAE